MKNIRPLFLRQLDVQLPGLRVRRLRLNRHLPETTAVRPHEHAYSQVLLYMGGRGLQQVGTKARQQTHAIRTGTAFFLPPGQVHAFTAIESRPPLCLVIDLDWRGAGRQPCRVAQLNLIDLAEVRQGLSKLGRSSRPGTGPDQLRASGIILQLLDTLCRALGLIAQPTRSAGVSSHPIVHAVNRVLATSPDELSLSEIATQIGYQQDYLNRVLKTATGLTLGQMRSQQRVLRAQRLLKESRRVSDVATQLGFEDANYFTRWFRLQTGQSPRRWQRT